MSCNYLRNKKHFVNFFLRFGNLDQVVNILEKQMILIAYVFPMLQTAKDVITQISKKSFFRSTFEKQHGKRSQKLLKSALQLLYNIYWSLLRKLTRKKSVLVICKILGLFVNTLTAGDKYSLFNRDILTQPIET